MCTDVSVTRCVLDGPVVSLPRIRLVLKMNAVAMIFRDKSKIDQVNVVLFCHKESIFFVFDHGAATASVTGHT